MSDKPIPFVITDRRKFNAEGEPREGYEPPPARETTREPATGETSEPADNLVQMPAPDAAPPAETSPVEAFEATRGLHAVESDSESQASEQANETDDANGTDDANAAAAPTAEQMDQSKRAFDATAERIDLAMRAANPGADHPPALTFESLIQSVYMDAVMQLGGATPPGEQPRIDLMGARQSIDMLGLLADKTTGNLSKSEETLLLSALFELRLAFLEMTQALARQAAARNPVPGAGGPGGPAGPGGIGGPGGPGGPRIVR